MRCQLILLISEHPIQQGIRKGGGPLFGYGEESRGRGEDRMAYSRQQDDIIIIGTVHQFFLSSSSVLHQFLIGSASVLHQLFVSSSSVFHRFFISFSSAPHQFFISSSSVLHQSVISSLSALHQLFISSSSALRHLHQLSVSFISISSVLHQLFISSLILPSGFFVTECSAVKEEEEELGIVLVGCHHCTMGQAMEKGGSKILLNFDQNLIIPVLTGERLFKY